MVASTTGLTERLSTAVMLSCVVPRVQTGVCTRRGWRHHTDTTARSRWPCGLRWRSRVASGTWTVPGGTAFLTVSRAAGLARSGRQIASAALRDLMRAVDVL